MAEGAMMTQLMFLIKKNIIALIFAVGIFAPVFWMLIDREVPYEITNGRITPEQPVKNGYIEVTWEIKPLRSCDEATHSRVTRKIVDSKGVVHSYSITPGSYEGTSQMELSRHIALPMNIVGAAKYSATACYACNPIQLIWPICLDTPTLEFVIADQ